MGDGKDKRDVDFSFMQETIKQKKLYQTKIAQRLAWSVAAGALFGVTALLIWALVLPRLDLVKEPEVQQIVIPEDVTGDVETEEIPIYITEQVSMELEDYKKMYQQLMQIGNQVEKSLVNVSAVTVDTDWFDETFTSQSSSAGVLIGDNGLEILILTDYDHVRDAENLLITFYDHTTAQAVLKKYDRNTGLAVISVNISDVTESTRGAIMYAEWGTSRTLRDGEPVIAVGSPIGSFGSLLFGNLTSAAQVLGLYDGIYNILTTDMVAAESGSGVLVNWSGKIVGLIENDHKVNGQKGTIQAFGISDIKTIIEHLSNNQDIVYMGVMGADVTTAVSEAEEIPIGVYVSEVAMESPAIEAGIQPGDIITAMSGQPITNLKDIMSILLKCSNGQSVQVVCQRPSQDGYQELELKLTLKILE